MKYILSTILLLTSFISVEASHVPGGNITYECIGPNTYVVTLTVFEDCGTAFIGNMPESISVINTCGLPFSSKFTHCYLSTGNFSVVLPMIGQSECNGGGFQEYICMFGGQLYLVLVIVGFSPMTIVVEMLLKI